MTLYKKTYRVETSRHPSHNYAYGMYFVTMCTKKKMQWFGEIKNGIMQLSAIGKIVEQYWRDIPLHFSGTHLDDFVIMPNHIHAILQPNRVETRESRVSTEHDAYVSYLNDAQVSETRRVAVETHTAVPETHTAKSEMPETRAAIVETRESRVSTMNERQISVTTLGIILNQFKGSATKKIRASGFTDFQWQSRYHDRVIRSEKELAAIKQYITQNPDMWDKETIPWHADANFWNV